MNEERTESFDRERRLWRLFQKCVVHSKLNIYVFIIKCFNEENVHNGKLLFDAPQVSSDFRKLGSRHSNFCFISRLLNNIVFIFF